MKSEKSVARDLETKFWGVRKLVRPGGDIKPINLDREKERFFSFKSRQQPYNPIFEYRRPEGLDKIDYLRDLVTQANDLSSPPTFLPLAEDLIVWVSEFSDKKESFGEWLYSLYGAPNEALVSYARDTLKNQAPDPPLTENITSNDAKKFFCELLKDYRLSHWSVQLTHMPAKVSVNSAETTIYINSQSSFTEIELKRLGVHEIGTHVLRYENGSKQSSEVYRYGFPRYLDCEEGLAIRSEERAGLLSAADLQKYSLRVIACSLAERCSFNEVFDQLAEHTSSELAFSIATRVKRGLSDTSQPFGYSKDQVYLSGYRAVCRIPEDDIWKLFVGKIGFNELENLDFDSFERSNITIPEWWTISDSKNQNV